MMLTTAVYWLLSGSKEQVEQGHIRQNIFTMECRHLENTRFRKVLQQKSATPLIGPMCPLCKGVNGLVLSETGWGSRICATCRYAGDVGNRSSIVSSGRPA